MAISIQSLRRTPLHDRHLSAGARTAGFAGWEMPIQYSGIREEHMAVRTAAGLFDVSHMGQIETSGPDAEAFLQRLLSNDVARIAPGGAQYSLLCNEDGGVLDDVFTYRLHAGGRSGDSAHRYLTVTNAANHQCDYSWFQQQASGFDVSLRDSTADHAMLALQGPTAHALLARRIDGEAPQRMRVTRAAVAGVQALVCGTGYTGEDGVELLLPPDGAAHVWDALVGDGAVPAGLGARDTLRIEVCYPLYGNELRADGNPIEAGLGWCCKEETGFIGAEAVAAARARGPVRKLFPFTIVGPGIARAGNPVIGGGEVTSGTLSPCLGCGIGMAYIGPAQAEPGTRIEIDVRGRVRTARIAEKPLYRKPPG